MSRAYLVFIGGGLVVDCRGILVIGRFIGRYIAYRYRKVTMYRFNR